MRKNQAEKRTVLPDPIYNSRMVTKLINKLGFDSKKGKAYKILYKAFEIINSKTNQEPMEVFKKSLENISPQLELLTRRVGGTHVQVPVEVSTHRQKILILRWLINYARLRPGKNMEEKLAAEIIDASNGIGGAVKKKEDTHKMAEANKSFAHYRW